MQGQDYPIDGEDLINVSILDSSFNPPTMAHLALSRLSNTTTSVNTDFNAKLLLYSMKNADKVPTLGDTSPSERVEMMILLAKELERLGAASVEPGSSQNIAVAVCQEPIFVEKSKILQAYFVSRMEYLSSSSSTTTMVRLTFLLGIDTLERLFMPKYYGTEEDMRAAMQALFASDNGTRVLCVRRAFGQSYMQSDPELVERDKDYVASGAVVFTDIEEELSSISSSEVRKNIQQGKTTSLWKGKVIDTIAQYIEEHGLYREQ
ncbi:hypothetical protein Clacol_002556 [Clathrus columnatus]|uniref:Nicotinamide-nucleotide adenylyltransferase n=1 Tax=Clathrus columnatus TaxID=1419009 RepID=A0AAV5A5U7_9AGAM|nr:hypothetical protein Clacol_002556 [Clathrus columnatus]